MKYAVKPTVSKATLLEVLYL